MELLTKKIADEYRRRALALPPNGLQDIGDRRKLRIELQKKCGVTELEAVNILNGFHADIYIKIHERREKERAAAENKDNAGMGGKGKGKREQRAI